MIERKSISFGAKLKMGDLLSTSPGGMLILSNKAAIRRREMTGG